ncbi:hypothetical protein AX17_005437, partial [Amanita inopinata Kibby_2008]
MSYPTWPRNNLVENKELLPKWIFERLYNLGTKSVRYEASFSGPHNAFLQTYFDPGFLFLIKPIPRIRTQASTDEEAAGRTSKDSYNQKVEIRSDDAVPDFLVCASGPGLHDDRPLLLWELKRDDKDATRTAAQAAQYERWIRAYQDAENRAVTSQPNTIYLAIVEKSTVTITQFDPSDLLVISTICDVLSTELDTILKRIRNSH